MPENSWAPESAQGAYAPLDNSQTAAPTFPPGKSGAKGFIPLETPPATEINVQITAPARRHNNGATSPIPPTGAADIQHQNASARPAITDFVAVPETIDKAGRLEENHGKSGGKYKADHEVGLDGTSARTLSRPRKNTQNTATASTIIRSPLTTQIRKTIRTEDPLADPVGRQYWPDAREAITTPEENPDPIGDHAHMPVKGIVHRYPDRALLKITDSCAVYCRFCFRKEMVGQGAGILNADELDAAIAYIETHPAIREVILTGGDPLTLSNRRLGGLLRRLEQIPHIEFLRIHTRTPMVKPDRIDDGFAAMAASLEKPLYIALHVNHPQELDGAVRAAILAMARAGAILLGQTVLLKGINDDPAILEDLFRTLTANRVRPYYLHHPDLAPGTGHFRLTIKEGQDIVKQLRGKLSGIAQPTYVLDIPGGYGKMPLTPCYLEELKDGTYRVADYQGGSHLYPPQSQHARTDSVIEVAGDSGAVQNTGNAHIIQTHGKLHGKNGIGQGAEQQHTIACKPAGDTDETAHHTARQDGKGAVQS